MAAELFKAPFSQLFTSAGAVLNAGKIFFYSTGTSTAKDTYPTYADAVARTNPNTNPVILDSSGRFITGSNNEIWLNGQYRAVLQDSAGAQIGGAIDGLGSESTLDTFDSGYLSGLILSLDAGDTSHDIGISAGEAKDAADSYDLVLASAIVKRLDATWAVGTAQGGLDTGASAANTTYFVWLIARTDTGVVDALFSLSSSAPTMPTNYDKKRMIGAGRTDGSSNWTQAPRLANREVPINDTGTTKDGIFRRTLPITAAYTLQLVDEGVEILANATGGAITVTLLAAATALKGYTAIFKKTDSSANAITLDGNASETIDGATTLLLRKQYDAVMLVCDGTNWHVAMRQMAPTEQVFSASGTWTKPVGCRRVRVRIRAGGGGGGGVSNAAASKSASGGGQGEYGEKWIDAPGATETVTIGAGGTAGSTAGGNGGTGGTSSFGSHITAIGGGGGNGATAEGSQAGGLGGTGGASGDLYVRGAPGGNSSVGAGGTDYCIGAGGGDGGGAATAAGNNGAAGVMGGGGSGCGRGTGNSASGGAGGDGWCAVEEHY